MKLPVVGVVVTSTVAGLHLLGGIQPAIAESPVLYVNGSASSCSDHQDRTTARSPASPLCTPTRAGQLAVPGDTVFIAPGRYTGTFSPATSGTPDAPITYAASGVGVILDAAGGRVALKAISVANLVFSGITITGANAQGVWLQNTDNITLTNVSIIGNQGRGMQTKDTRGTQLKNSSVTGNMKTGVQELGGGTGGIYDQDFISGNGRDGEPYNGDGIQLDSAGSIVRNCTITDNGDHPMYEHGIYTSVTATGFLIESNMITGNAATAVKAEGSGTIRYNTLGQMGNAGLYASRQAGAGLSVYYNVIMGSFAAGVSVASGGHVLLSNNSIINTRASGGGQPAGVLVDAHAAVRLRNNIMSVAHPIGRAIVIPTGTGVTIDSDHNWLAVPGAKLPAVWNGRSVSLPEWTAAGGQDAHSVVSVPPTFGADGQVLSVNHGVGIGEPLGLTRDIRGVSIPATSPDAGAYQHLPS
ncbi:right-handed parallel beta-helix repeat-containing protein [Frankia sp. Cppng1_Ct_nod]|uniref:right-handed parallel beta-helix repeat-containing protein n=1 Tax=Frankia sp. Cppng1_Ct_nod TaxID=2897162 RepID=UPI002025B4BB|nr:right-handed parallel beta-helix repeat-containing protein [Frankia sp. Cppng1_Ct_nod]